MENLHPWDKRSDRIPAGHWIPFWTYSREAGPCPCRTLWLHPYCRKWNCRFSSRCLRLRWNGQTSVLVLWSSYGMSLRQDRRWTDRVLYSGRYFLYHRTIVYRYYWKSKRSCLYDNVWMCFWSYHIPVNRHCWYRYTAFRRKLGIENRCNRILPASGYSYTYRSLFPIGTSRWQCLSTYVWSPSLW